MAIDVTARAMAANADSKAVTAYEIAVQEGYTGSEQDFADDMALLGTNAAAVNSAVRFDEDQNKTSTEQLQAQSNIGLDTSKGDINTQLANKANIDGSYDGMTSGLAGNFISNTFIEDAEPYNFRTSGGSADVGDREYLENLVGGTLAINQLAREMASTYWEGVLGTASFADGVGTLTATQKYGVLRLKSGNHIALVAGHKYFISITAKTTTETNLVFAQLRNSTDTANLLSFTLSSSTTKRVFTAIYSPSTSENAYIRVMDTRESGWDAIEVSKVMLIDLTALFGTIKQTVGGTNYNSIADYVYALGNTNGVAWLYKYFPKLNGGYIPYSAPKLESVCADEHITDGFNQWDEQWETGRFNTTTGANNTANDQIRAKNLISIFPSTTYYVKAPTDVWVMLYDISKQPINASSIGADASHRSNNCFRLDGINHTFTSLANAYYMRFYATNDYGGTYKNDICINLRWDGERDGEYSAYVSHTYPMGHETLRGVYMLDANGNLYLNPNTNDMKVSDGTITNKWYEYTITGNETFSAPSATPASGYAYRMVLPSGHAYKIELGDTINYMSEKFTQIAPKYAFSFMNIGQFKTYGDGATIDFCSSQATLDGFKSEVTGMKITYELATPTTESGTPYTYVEVVDNWGTERFTDYGVEQGTRAVAVPVGHVTKYPPDLKAKLEMSPESPDGDGDYIVRQSGGENSYVLLPKELPNDPSGGDGVYSLVCTVSGGVATKSWVADT